MGDGHEIQTFEDLLHVYEDVVERQQHVLTVLDGLVSDHQSAMRFANEFRAEAKIALESLSGCCNELRQLIAQYPTPQHPPAASNN